MRFINRKSFIFGIILERYYLALATQGKEYFLTIMYIRRQISKYSINEITVNAYISLSI